MKKKKVTAQAKRRLLVFGPICLIAILYFIFSFFYNINDIFTLKKEKEQLESQYTKLQDDADHLKTEIIKLKNPEYLAKFARENYYYSKDGELIIKLDDSKQDVNDENETIKDYRILMYVSITIVGLIFIYIFIRGIKKNKK